MPLHQPRSLVRRSDAPEHSEDVVRTREALQELVQTEGWKLFVMHTARSYQGEGYRGRMATALNKSGDNTDARVVHQTSLEILRLLQWPEEQLRQLTGDPE